MAEISIIIPAYNAERTIRRTVESVLAQTLSDWEAILINDGSTDQTIEQVNAINDKRIKIFSYENAGQATARNRGIARSTGKFLAFLDADDLWTPDKLEHQKKALLEYPQAGLAYSWTLFLDEEGLIQYKQKPVFFRGDVLGELLKNNFLMCGSSPLISRKVVEVVGYFDTNLPPLEDWDYWLRIAAKYPFTLVPKYQTFYCKSKISSSSKIERVEEKILTVIERAYCEVPAKLHDDKTQSLANASYYLASQYLNYQSDTNGLKKARKHFYRALRLDPRLGLRFSTSMLGMKLLLMFLFSPTWVNHCVHFYRKMQTQLNSDLLPRQHSPSTPHS